MIDLNSKWLIIILIVIILIVSKVVCCVVVLIVSAINIFQFGVKNAMLIVVIDLMMK